MVMDGRSRKPLQRALMGGGVVSGLLYTTSACYVWDLDPNQNLGSLAAWRIIMSEGFYGNLKYIALGKFSSIGSGNYNHFQLGRVKIILGVKDSVNADDGALGFPPNAEVRLHKVTEDFNTATFTYNDWAGLAKAQIASQTVYCHLASSEPSKTLTMAYRDDVGNRGISSFMFRNGANLDFDGSVHFEGRA